MKNTVTISTNSRTKLCSLFQVNERCQFFTFRTRTINSVIDYNVAHDHPTTVSCCQVAFARISLSHIYIYSPQANWIIQIARRLYLLLDRLANIYHT